MTWAQRHMDDRGRVWIVVLAGKCPEEDCPYRENETHAHQLREDGQGLGIVTASLRPLGLRPR